MFSPELAAALPEMRALAESRMTSTCNILRPTGRRVQDEETGAEHPEWFPVHVDLPMRLAGAERGSSGTRTITVAGVEMQVPTRTAHFPAATSDLEDGDFIDITAGENAGRVFRIVEAEWHDQATARRVPVIGEQRPEEWDF